MTIPHFDECPCEWGRTRWQAGVELEERIDILGNAGTAFEHSWNRYMDMETGEALHGYLEAMDGDRPLEAVNDLLSHMADECVPCMVDLIDVFAQHNWRDPVGANHLARTLQSILEGYRAENRRIVAVVEVPA